MGARLRHRGPDSGDWEADGETLLVHRRLSIIDLSEAGSQPLWNEDHTVCVIVNGEIYNFRELRCELEGRGHRFRSSSDSEVIVHLYEERGIWRCCQALEGMFAFALWDARSRDLYLVRDRLGIKPLLLCEHREGITFGSTLQSLLMDPAVPRDVRPEALLAVLQVGFVPSPWSVLAAVRPLQRGSCVHVRAGRVVEERTWWTDECVDVEPDAEAELHGALRGAVRSHLVADVPIGLFLSAGIDSGLVAALTATEGEPPTAWSVSNPGHLEDEFPEARQVAEHLRMDLHEIRLGTSVNEDDLDVMVQASSQPLADASLIGLHRMFRNLAQNRRVVLTGDGGDELFGGYDWHAGMPSVPDWAKSWGFRSVSRPLSLLSSAAGRIGTLGAVAALVNRHPATVYLDKLRICSDEELRDVGIDSVRLDPLEQAAIGTWDSHSRREELERMLAVDRATSLVDQMLAKVDSSSMWYGVEARVPYLDSSVVRAAKTLPGHRKRNGNLGKIALREWYATLCPAHLANRRKTGFNSPISAWMSAPIGDVFRERAMVAFDAVGARRRSASPRLVFAAAVLGTWLHSLRQTQAPAP